MTTEETELEMVQRHVRQGERHVSRQIEIIADIKFCKQPTSSAENMLFSFDRSLRVHKSHLDQLASN